MKQFDEMYAVLHCHGWEHMFKIYLQIFLSAAFSKKKQDFFNSLQPEQYWIFEADTDIDIWELNK